MRLKQLTVYFEEGRPVNGALILYGKGRRGDFAIYSFNRNGAPKNRVVVATGDDPYVHIVREVVQPNGERPIIIPELKHPPQLMDTELDTPDKLVGDVLRADEAASKAKYGSKRYQIAEMRLAEAGENLFRHAAGFRSVPR